MAEWLDDILKRVASGELAPEEALRLIEPEAAGGAAVGSAEESAAYGGSSATGREPGTAPDPLLREPGTDGAGDDAVRAVRLQSAYRQITVIADAGVRQVMVSGEHTVRREGDLMIVDGGLFVSRPGWERGEQGSGFSFAALPRTVAWARAMPDAQLTLRINPELPLQLDLTGASVRLAGMEAGVRARLLACSFKVDRLRGPVDLDLRTSSMKGTLGPTGSSRISVEQSSLKIALLPDVGVDLSATNRMSKIMLPGVTSKGAGTGETIRSRVGSGVADLAIDALMSSVAVTCDAVVAGR
jgi:hypothetical protein